MDFILFLCISALVIFVIVNFVCFIKESKLVNSKLNRDKMSKTETKIHLRIIDNTIVNPALSEPTLTIVKGVEDDDYEIEYFDPSSEEPHRNPTYKLKHKTRDFNLEIQYIFRPYSSSFYSPTIYWASHTELELIYNACTSKCKKKYEDKKLIERQRVINLLKGN